MRNQNAVRYESIKSRIQLTQERRFGMNPALSGVLGGMAGSLDILVKVHISQSGRTLWAANCARENTR